MAHCAIVGINWGDEGKGRMVDYLAEQYDVVIRYQGGNNAGHTVINQCGEFKLNLMLSGIFRPGTINLLGAGTVIDLKHINEEMDSVRARGVELTGRNFKISDRAIMVLPFHPLQDQLEEIRLGKDSYGSTLRGISPVYGDKYMKKALQMGDLLHPETLRKHLKKLIDWKNAVFAPAYGQKPIRFEETLEWINAYGSRLIPHIVDAGELLETAQKEGREFLFEAQLGALRDIDYGIYPFSSSSSPLAAYASCGCGFPAAKVDRVVGVTKAYSTCVGEGPFVGELDGEEAAALREAGQEYGAATGRPRRVAWLDLVATRYGVKLQGATSCYVTDNADILILRDALQLIRTKIVETLRRLRAFALEYRDLPTLGLTHLQPAQPVTVGKRAALWMQDLLMDLNDLDDAAASLKMLGCRGATGTQASFMALFDNDHEKVKQLDRRIAEKMGMDKVFPVSGQTYPRKLDFRMLSVLSGVAQSAYKFAQDLRVLQHMREIEEPFEKNQIGSSAMAYKRNPMRSERICALSRHVITLMQDAAMTACTQWFERTLDDSANRRLSLPEAFLATDAVLELYAGIAGGMVVYPRMIARNLGEHLPFLCTENILMEAVRLGGDRQALHEKIRVHSQAAAARVKAEGLHNDLLERIADDPAFPLDMNGLNPLLNPRLYIGRSPEQTTEFIEEYIDPLITGEASGIGGMRI